MSLNNFLIRDDNIGKIIDLEEDKKVIETLELLKKFYTPIYESMMSEKYNLLFKTSRIFREIVYDKKVVGFVTIEAIDLGKTIKYTLTEAYIIPEYRGNNLLYNLIEEHTKTPGLKFGIKNPNKSMINVLLKNHQAIHLTNDIIISLIDLDTDLGNIYTNRNLIKLYKDINDNLKEAIVTSHYYNDKLCSIILNDDEAILSTSEDTPYLSNPRPCDIKQYNLRKKLKNISQQDLISMMFSAMANFEELEKEIKKQR